MPSKQNLFHLKVSDLVEEKLQRDEEEWYEELSNNTKSDVKTEHVEIDFIREIEKQQAEVLPLLLYHLNIIIDTSCF